ncbi:sialidase family protein [Spirosoma linguale]|uniref:BNR/Asp-box repeat domain protein n=1 Tax=Spirosoma linguale (strain ATCC 33905 / DSM 74 / LMG 10896 / Claus 1) TaxID=504472 RepID=D2QR01_SPILD|nr:BNR/Asp-box repeat domain protein [Spirosoma linguale DSM 74]
MKLHAFYLSVFFAVSTRVLPAQPANPAVLKSEFIYEQAPFPECHASTIAETPQGLMTAWFGGTRERHPDVGIWVSSATKSGWTTPVEVATGVQADGKRLPCWNPVLFQVPKGELLLFYKVGPSPSTWWGMLKRSTDGGKSWSAAERLPDGIAGPIKNKPVLLPSGVLLCPSSSEDHNWRVHFEQTSDWGKTWQRTEAINDGVNDGAIQPSILFHPGGQLQALCRSQRTGFIAETWSTDGGKSWSPLQKTTLPNPNSGTDAVTLADGRQVLVYNPVSPTPGKSGGPRTPLEVAISSDGKTWKTLAVLENTPGEYSYPAVIQTADGLLQITYTWKRQRIRHVVVDPKKVS